MLPPATLSTIYEVCKVAGVVITAGVAFVGLLKWMIAIYTNLHQTTANVNVMMSNHIPHIQAALDESNASVAEIKLNVCEIDTRVRANVERMTDIKDSLSQLGSEFVAHIEMERRDAIIMHAIGAENKVNIAAIAAANKIASSAVEAKSEMAWTTQPIAAHVSLAENKVSSAARDAVIKIEDAATVARIKLELDAKPHNTASDSVIDVVPTKV
jgi:hypothetical protein